MKSIKYKLLLTLTAIFTSLGYSNNLMAQETGEEYKIIFQLTDNDPKSQKALTGQLNNLITGWPKAEVEVVVHSAGISYLLKSESKFKSELETLAKKGIVFKACENTLRSRGIDKSEVLDLAGFVPMGIGEVVKKQMEGWAYIKAGL